MSLTNPLLVMRIAISVGVEIKAGRQNQRHQRFMFAAKRVIDALHLRAAASKFRVGNSQSSRAGRATLHAQAIRGDEEISQTTNGGRLGTRVHQTGASFGVKSRVSADDSHIESPAMIDP